ncbi:hypothetical protein P7D58_02510 [Enterococcus avium]|uniref:hypothetical protein n=1 Tax=Enterococcus avium TaxID=33945 RepID=UPI00288F1C5F|nr:hypothetical protein [Enterococcus avium]MDT2392776.1 hypothetical protein [Enterococcus avium]MDT2416588.1 hypothetical protein [Enterococcus avium]MDT2429878.1 hypothetical protein [Enterococcus avium]MDT2438906.1 hypothetical protein [Enterococcus avium]MDT2451984.1 hypothetical protein [Enterococcus avium]
MRVQIRKSVAGIEYWDTEEKRSIFVPHGQEPDFEVADNPDSLLVSESEKKVVAKAVVGDGVIFNTGDEVTLNDSESIEEPKQESDDKEPSELDGMTIKQLRQYAKKNNITIPAAIKTRGDILNVISNAR